MCITLRGSDHMLGWCVKNYIWVCNVQIVRDLKLNNRVTVSLLRLTLKVAVFCGVTPCSQVEIDWHFRRRTVWLSALLSCWNAFAVTLTLVLLRYWNGFTALIFSISLLLANWHWFRCHANRRARVYSRDECYCNFSFAAFGFTVLARRRLPVVFREVKCTFILTN
jgi:hypothetical protein